MIEGFPYTEYPTGWFQVAWSPQVELGQIVPLEFFGRKLICFRTESGAVQVMDAFCPHMGAHLAYGGAVEGDGVRCGFHGWCWGSDGRNTDIPYGAQKTLNISIRVYPTVETEGLVLMWFSPTDAPPSWDPPSILPAETQFFDVYPSCAGGDRIRMQPQMMVENTVDVPHLAWVHRWTAGEPELLRCESNGHHFVAQFRGFMPSPQGTVTMDVTENMYGLGLIVAPSKWIRDAVNVASVVPIDHEYSYVFLSTFVSCPEGSDPAVPDRVALAMARAQQREVIGAGGEKHGDRKIWENQRYVVRPPLVPEEADSMRAIRHWCQQFYPESTAVETTNGSETYLRRGAKQPL